MSKKIFINKNFFLLWIGKIISQLGDKFYAIALAWWILQKTNSPSIMGFFLLVSVLPGLIFGFFAGTLIDRWNRKNVLIVTDVIRGLLVMAIVLLSKINSLQVWQVFVIGAAISLTTAFFDPAIQAIIPQVVAKENFNEANAMSQMVNGICTVLGPLFGAVAVSLFGVTYVFLFNGISYFASAVLEKMVVLTSDYRANKETKNITEEMKEGLLFLIKKKEILRVIVIIAIAHFFLGSLMVIIPFLANKLKGNGVQNLGNLQAMLGGGLLIGSIYIRRKKIERIKEHHLVKLIILVGASFLIISFEQLFAIKSVIPYMIILALIGGSVACAAVFWQSLIQLNTPNHMTGRVFSVSTLAGNVSLPIAYGIFGILLTYVSIVKLMLFSGCCLILLCLILNLWLKIKKA